MRQILLACLGALSVAAEPGIAPPRPLPPLPPPVLKLPPSEQPVRIRSCAIDAQVHGVLAEVRTTLVFENPNPRALAGDLEFPLPDDATVCAYALDVGGRLVDGVVVSQERARVVLETESRRGVDPGLVEHVRGNAFRTRVFPLPANGTRTVSVTWAAPLAISGGEAALRLPLPRTLLPTLDLQLDVAAGEVSPRLGGFGNLGLTRWQAGHRAEAHLTAVTPDDDLLVRLPALPRTLVQVEERHGERFAVICDDPQLDAGESPAPRRLAVAWDASGSATPAAAARGRAVLAGLMRRHPGLVIDLVVFRDAPEAPRAFADPAALDAHLAALPCDGATGLARLDLRRAALPHADCSGWLLVSDGLGTIGDGLPACGDVPVTCLASEALRDIAVLRLIAARSGGQVIDLTATDAAAAAALVTRPPVTLARVDAPAGVLADVQPMWIGGRSVILARVQADGDATVVYRRAGTEFARSIARLRTADAAPGSAVSRAWAGARAADLAVFPELNQSALLALGRTYGVVTAGTSLIVLESLDQYVRHGVQPPETWPELRDQWMATLKQRRGEDDARLAQGRERLIGLWSQRVAWWEGKLPMPAPAKQLAGAALREARNAATAAPAPSSPEQPTERAVADHESGPGDAVFAVRMAGGRRLATGSAGGSAASEESDKKDGVEAGPIAGAIAITAFDPDTPYLRALKAAPADQAYATYLRERQARGGSPSFFLDCGSFLAARDKALGARVLSNLAEMRLDDPALLRVLAWRLQDAGDLDTAIGVLRKVLRLRPEEPQSYRDLALALAARWEAGHAVGDAGEALALLQRVFERRPLEDRDLGERWAIDANWDRFRDIEVFALEEFNRLVARIQAAPSDKPVQIPAIDQRLARNLDCDLRVVMAWDADGTDIDLHVVQPDGDEAYYGRNRTSAGGLVSDDVTQGYGPEEYLLRKAAPGSYQIRCRYFGSRQQGLLGPATVTATAILDWGRPGERSQRITLRLDKQGDAVPVGVITVGAGGGAQPQATTGSVDRAAILALKPGMALAAVEAALGRPARRDGGGVQVLWYRLADSGTMVRIGFAPELLWIREVLDGAERDLLR